MIRYGGRCYWPQILTPGIGESKPNWANDSKNIEGFGCVPYFVTSGQAGAESRSHSSPISRTTQTWSVLILIYFFVWLLFRARPFSPWQSSPATWPVPLPCGVHQRDPLNSSTRAEIVYLDIVVVICVRIGREQPLGVDLCIYVLSPPCVTSFMMQI